MDSAPCGFESNNTDLLNCKTPAVLRVGLVWSVSQWVICAFCTAKDNMKSLLSHICCICLPICRLSRLLKVQKNNLSPPHCSLHGERDKSAVPFNTKGRQSKTEEDSLTVWGRLVAHNRCYFLINNSVCQGWAWAPHPSEAQCINFDTHKIKELIAYDVIGCKW